MGTLTAVELLDVWERGLNRPHPERALGLLAAASADKSIDELADLSIGRRDAHLLRLREQLFGRQLTVVARCPACGDPVESTFSVDDVRLAETVSSETQHSAEAGGWRATFRLPTSRDLLALADADSAHHGLLQRCILEVRRDNGEPMGVDSLSPEIVSAIEARMTEIDPQAEIDLALECPFCGHHWTAAFDIATFLWKELHVWALRTLRDVHYLARSYGWREADVLALSATRRQIYMELSRQ